MTWCEEKQLVPVGFSGIDKAVSTMLLQPTRLSFGQSR
jgi:hypothetical protein